MDGWMDVHFGPWFGRRRPPLVLHVSLNCEKHGDEEACKEGEEVNAEEDGIQMGKVIDASLYGTDIMTDGIQFVHHRLNCHWRWAIGTATFMLMPAVVEAIALALRWITWIANLD